MGNCLVTKLKSVVNNSDLKKLGVLRFEVDVTSIVRNNSFHCNTPNHCKFTIVSGPEGGQIVTVRNPATSDIPLGTEFFLNNSADSYYFSELGKYVIEITNKYDITNLEIRHKCSILLDDMKYSILLRSSRFSGVNVIGNFENLLTPETDSIYINGMTAEYLATENVVGDIAVIANTPIKALFLEYCAGIEGDLSSLSSHPTLSTLDVNSSTKITGKISDITSIPHLSNFQCSNNNLISGSLADFLDSGQLRNPELKILVVSNTNIVKNSEDVATLRNLGVQVTV